MTFVIGAGSALVVIYVMAIGAGFADRHRVITVNDNENPAPLHRTQRGEAGQTYGRPAPGKDAMTDRYENVTLHVHTHDPADCLLNEARMRRLTWHRRLSAATLGVWFVYVVIPIRLRRWVATYVPPENNYLGIGGRK